MANIEELKKEATELGIKFMPKISAEKLQEKIDSFKADVAKEPAGVKVAEATSSVSEVVMTAPEQRIMKRKKEAEEMITVTVVDNDQRVNNIAETCTVNCSNEYFDLGTVVIPLNEPTKICRGHYNVLKEVKIPLHKQGRVGDREGYTIMRNRYNVTIVD